MPRMPNLVIAEAATESGSMDISALSIIFIYPPAALAGVVTPVVAAVSSDTHIPLQSPFGTDIVISAGKAIGIILHKGAVSLKLKTTVAPGAGGETFKISGGIT